MAGKNMPIVVNVSNTVTLLYLHSLFSQLLLTKSQICNIAMARGFKSLLEQYDTVLSEEVPAIEATEEDIEACAVKKVGKRRRSQ